MKDVFAAVNVTMKRGDVHGPIECPHQGGHLFHEIEIEPRGWPASRGVNVLEIDIERSTDGGEKWHRWHHIVLTGGQPTVDMRGAPLPYLTVRRNIGIAFPDDPERRQVMVSDRAHRFRMTLRALLYCEQLVRFGGSLS